ncbi:UDP-N-acetylmuramoyl-tripeptide--D-alanyl-D-alanine ligase [Polaribacter huanghezhanensis]|uniref:UDP-N-acetylmuramoyl-tripeptide--D-alanyl-D- alanine ligase n=1 Tax=Polaribacter huanghezhanensis TaxID=1354726 RepID=UPI0026479137|nr:UDP-N-acetylmuramoyl-tripeptide--D-alanyl-D-alanine ligase [Polaribacter huanghezhanensis]WKD86123.1 UDP-N-acetylmuramoyl-tripeptide--D-alanyl-D-alanine ligase [Polaribacter huanghezhanensis]
MNIETLYNIYSQHYLVDTDSRKIRKNTIYFALKGEHFNGNVFAEEALSKGALYSIVDEKKYVTTNTIILVENVLETLQHLAKYHRKKLSIPIIGLTGSNGKTTTKELINAVLETQYKTTATLGNLNNHIGVPLTLLSMTPKTEIGIVEMGANHPKEIEFLCAIATPDFGYITNFGKAHLEGFGSIEGVIEAKSELYDYIKNNDKTVFVNTNNAIQVEKTTNSNAIPLSNSIQFIAADPFVMIQFENKIIQTNLIGTYNFSNISAAITIGHHFKITNAHIKKALENYQPTNNRSQIITTKKKNTIVLDAYNANPTSMKAALDNFSALKSDNKIAILGDMFELGKESLQEHQFINDYCTELGLKDVILVGSLFNKTTTQFTTFQSFDLLQNYLENKTFQNQHILIKGSRGMALERILDFIN